MNDYLLGILSEQWQDAQLRPHYRALANLLRDMILSGKLVAGVQLPPSRKLSGHLGVSRNTVLQAVDMLTNDGFLETRQGAGVFVSSEFSVQYPSRAVDVGERDERCPDIARRAQKWLAVKKGHNLQGNIRPFAPGRPAMEDFPFDQWARLLSRRWRMNAADLAMREDVTGYLPLRKHLARYLKESRGVNCTAEQIIIVSGAQQGLDLIGRVLWEEGDRVVMEDPAYQGMDGVLQGLGVQRVSLPVDEEGIVLQKLERTEKIKSMMVMPSRNYPLGTTMSLSRRLDVLKCARDCQAWVVEDDFDSEFRFEGPPLSSLQGLDKDGRVIYVGTFSRIIFPALRLGYLVLPEPLIPPFMAAKSYSDGPASILHQAVLADFFEEGLFDSQLRRMKKLYANRRKFLLEKLERDFADILEVCPSDGGLHLCVLFKDQRDDVSVTQNLNKAGVTVRPLSPFYRCEAVKSGMVMGFAGYGEADLQQGLDVMKEILS